MSAVSTDGATKVRLLHISDTHFGVHDEKKCEALLSFARSWRPDIIAITGDILDSPLQFPWQQSSFARARSFLDDLNNLTPNVHCIPGNHDFLFGRILLRRFWQKISANTSFVFAHQIRNYDVCLIGVDSTHLSLRSLNNTGFFDRSRATLLDKEIDALRSRPRYDLARAIKIILVHHHPLPTMSADAEGMLYFKNAGVFLNFAVRHGVRLILHGHQHDPHLTVVGFGSDHDDDQIAILSAGSCTKMETEATKSTLRGHFYTVEVDPSESIISSYYYHDEPSEFIALDEFAVSRAAISSPVLLTMEQRFTLLPRGDMEAEEKRRYKRTTEGSCFAKFNIGVDEDSDGCPDIKSLNLVAEVDGLTCPPDDIKIIRDEERTKRIHINIPSGSRGEDFSIVLRYVWGGGFKRFIQRENDRGEFVIGTKGVSWCKIILTLKDGSCEIKDFRVFYKDKTKVERINSSKLEQGFIIRQPQHSNRVQWTAELGVLSPS